MQRGRSLPSVPAIETIGVIVFVICELYVALRMPFMAAVFAAQAVVLAALCWATSLLTDEAGEKRVAPRVLVLLQILWCVVVALAAAFRGNFTSSDARATRGLAWATVHHDAFAWFAHRVPADIALGLVNFIDYALIAGIVLFLLGVRPREMGLAAFRRGAARVALCWLALPVAAACVFIAGGRAAPAALVRAFGGNLLQNGVSEEFLFRGAILGRLRAIWSTRTALVVQAVLFGLWHVSGDLSQAHGAFALAIALALANHAIVGYAMGYLTVRTGNIATASMFHALLDTVAG